MSSPPAPEPPGVPGRDACLRRLLDKLGTTSTIWLPRGLTRDSEEFGTRGHIDIVATFTEPGVVPQGGVSARRMVLAGAASMVRHPAPAHSDTPPTSPM